MNYQIGVSKSSVSICLREFLKAFIKYANRFIRFPMEQDFYEIKGFSKVIGAIDGTHIEFIVPPNGKLHINCSKYSCVDHTILIIFLSSIPNGLILN